MMQASNLLILASLANVMWNVPPCRAAPCRAVFQKLVGFPKRTVSTWKRLRGGQEKANGSIVVVGSVNADIIIEV